MTGPSQLGPYRVTRLLGRGGMGAVFEGVHQELGTRRAIKVLSGRATGARLERFYRETQHLARVRHPNVIAIHEIGQTLDGLCYYAMDHVEGETLDQWASGDHELEAKLEVLAAVCRGVDALHAVGIVHRDLKPNNVIVRPDGAPVVLDLGIAFALDSDSRLTQTGAMVGTPLYMAPEQVSGKRPTPAADVFSLGLIVLELTSGLVLGELDQIPALCPPPRASDVNARLPVGLDRVLERALAERPEDRYQRAGELGDALQTLQAGGGLSRRGQRALALLTGLALLGLAGGGAALAAGRGRPAPEPTSVASPADPTPSAEPALSGSEVEAARAALERARRLTAPRARHEAAAAWLRANPRHPDRAAAEAVREEAQRFFPVTLLRRSEGLQPAGFDFAPDGAVAAAFGGELLRWKLGATPTPLPPVAIPGARVAVDIANDFVVGLDGDRAAGRPLSPNGAGWSTALGDEQRPGLVACGPQGKHVALGRASEACVLDAASHQVAQKIGPLPGEVKVLAFSPDGALLAVGCDANGGPQTLLGPKSILVWDLRLELRATSYEHMSRPGAACFLGPDLLAVGDNAGRISAYRVGKGSEPVLTLVGPRALGTGGAASGVKRAHIHPLRGLAPWQGRLVSVTRGDGDEEGELNVWDTTTGRPLREVTHEGALFGVCCSADGRWLLLSCKHGIELWLGPAADAAAR
ncbi:MAG: WD40 repeat domain-containing serine/threonine protein kinase [Planctomycetota bacterium]